MMEAKKLPEPVRVPEISQPEVEQLEVMVPTIVSSGGSGDSPPLVEVEQSEDVKMVPPEEISIKSHASTISRSSEVAYACYLIVNDSCDVRFCQIVILVVGTWLTLKLFTLAMESS